LASLLVVDDDAHIREVMRFALEKSGHHVTEAADGAAALALFQQQAFELLVLDIVMPEMDGLELCRKIRALGEVPIIFVSSRDEELDRVLGLELGGDDYMAKPFSPRELVARVRARLRRHAKADEGWRRSGRFELDAAGHRIRFDGALLDLTRYEYGLLEALLARPGAVLERSRLMDRVWGDALESGERTVDTHVKTVRAKLRAIAPDADPIRTVRGLGYAVHVDG
jgi:two-component system, OmpR family, catabolic regulation response regulator CreB